MGFDHPTSSSALHDYGPAGAAGAGGCLEDESSVSGPDGQGQQSRESQLPLVEASDVQEQHLKPPRVVERPDLHSAFR